MAIDAGIISIGGDVGQEKFVLLRTEQLLVGLQAYFLQISELFFCDQAVDLLFLQTTLPHLFVAFLESLISPYVDLLNLNVQTAVLEHHLVPLPLPHSALEEVTDCVEDWHLKVVITDHLGDETCQFPISCCFYYLPLAGLTHVGHIGFVLAFLSNIFFFLPCKKPICNSSQVEHKVLFELLRSIIGLILTIVFELRIFQANSISHHMLLLSRFCLKESLKVQHLQRVPMEVDPLRHYSWSWMNTSYLLYALEQIVEELIEAFLTHLLDSIGECQRVT